MTLYLIVTPDRFELPLAVGNSMRALACDYFEHFADGSLMCRKLKGRAPNSLETLKQKKLRKCMYFVRRVEVDDDPEAEG